VLVPLGRLGAIHQMQLIALFDSRKILQYFPHRHGENPSHRADRPVEPTVRLALPSKYSCNIRPRYSGPLDCARQIIAREGFKGLYRGLKVNFIGVMPEKAIKLAVNDACRNHFLQGNNGAPVTIAQG
jgi:hypothetical protein